MYWKSELYKSFIMNRSILYVSFKIRNRFNSEKLQAEVRKQPFLIFNIGNTFDPEKSWVEVRKKTVFRFHFTYPPSYESE